MWSAHPAGVSNPAVAQLIRSPRPQRKNQMKRLHVQEGVHLQEVQHYKVLKMAQLEEQLTTALFTSIEHASLLIVL